MFTRKKNLKRLGNVYSELNKQPKTEKQPTVNLSRLGNVYSELNNQRAQQKYDAGIFFDNDVKHRRDVSSVCNGFTAPVVFESSKWSPLGMEIGSKVYNAFIKRLSPKAKEAAAVIREILLAQGQLTEDYDQHSGIRPENIDELKKWVHKNEGKKLAAVFDFDRTLSVMEGGFFFTNSEAEWKTAVRAQTGPSVHRILDTFTFEGYLEYLVGGTVRLQMLQQMFDYLYKNNVDCFILTNNGGCPTARGMFQELGLLLTGGRPIPIICGADYRGIKSEAMKGKETNTGPLGNLRKLCITRGGQRNNRKTKRQRKH